MSQWGCDAIARDAGDLQLGGSHASGTKVDGLLIKLTWLAEPMLQREASSYYGRMYCNHWSWDL
jgi:hypothetical protein